MQRFEQLEPVGQGAEVQKTHYDTLKVSRDAPIEVIRAAYRALCLKHHPDRHPEDAGAADTMRLLNRAYEVLSDPERRREYDACIRQSEAEPSRMGWSSMSVVQPAHVGPEQGMVRAAASKDRSALHWWQGGILFASVVLLLGALAGVLSLVPEPRLDSWAIATPAPEDREAHIRRLAREVMPARIDAAIGLSAVPAVPEVAASSQAAPQSATGPQTLVEPAGAGFGDTPSGDAGGLAAHSGKEPRSTLELPAASPSTEAELPSGPRSTADAPDVASDSFESEQGRAE